jgi:hypothetical protein
MYQKGGVALHAQIASALNFRVDVQDASANVGADIYEPERVTPMLLNVSRQTAQEWVSFGASIRPDNLVREVALDVELIEPSLDYRINDTDNGVFGERFELRDISISQCRSV